MILMYVIIISNFSYVVVINFTYATTTTTTTSTKTTIIIIIYFIDYVDFIDYNVVGFKLDFGMIKDYYKMNFLHLFID